MPGMTTEDNAFNLELSRRKLFAAAGVGTGAAVFIAAGDTQAASAPGEPLDRAPIPAVSGLHLQFGADASSEVTVSWHTLRPIEKPRVVLGRLDGKFEQ